MASEILVDKIDPQSGTALEIGSSGDTMTVPSGATLTIAGTINASSGTATGFGGAAGANSFSVTGSGTQSSIADATWTKITFDSENWDTDNLFASNKFTATDAGKYFFTANVCLSYDSAAGPQFAGRFYKNGSGDSQTQTSLTFTTGTVNTVNARVTGILNLAASDYVELYGYADVGSGVASAPAARSMMGFRVA